MNINNNEYNDELNDEDESVGAKETFESKVIEDFIVEEENIKVDENLYKMKWYITV